MKNFDCLNVNIGIGEWGKYRLFSMSEYAFKSFCLQANKKSYV